MGTKWRTIAYWKAKFGIFWPEMGLQEGPPNFLHVRGSVVDAAHALQARGRVTSVARAGALYLHLVVSSSRRGCPSGHPREHQDANKRPVSV